MDNISINVLILGVFMLTVSGSCFLGGGIVFVLSTGNMSIKRAVTCAVLFAIAIFCPIVCCALWLSYI